MNKLNKIFTIVLTAAIATSLFIMAVPASAAVIPQTWNKTSLPSATSFIRFNGDNVTAPTLTAAGPIAASPDGATLYTYVNVSAYGATPAAFAFVKSTDGGRTWAVTGTVGQPTGQITSIKTIGTSIYYAMGTGIYRSTDGGATFANIVTAAGNINSIDAAVIGGVINVVMGTDTGVFTFADTAGFTIPVTQIGIGPGTGIIKAVALSPNAATDRGVAVVDSAGTAWFTDFATAWGTAFAGETTVATTSAVIKFASDFTITAPKFYFGTAGGVFQFVGAGTTPTNLTQSFALPSSFGTPKVVSLDVNGTGATQNLVAGLTSMGTKSMVIFSTNAGLTWSTPTKLIAPLSSGAANKAYIMFKSDFATSGAIYALVGGAGLAADDQSGFSVSVDKGVSFNQYSLENVAVTTVNDVVASGSTTFVSTTAQVGVGPTAAITAGTFTVTAGSHAVAAVPASTVTFTAIAGSSLTFNVTAGTVSTSTTGGASVIGNTVLFTAAGQTATFSATAAAVISAVDSASGAVTVAVANGGVLTSADPAYSATLPTVGAGPTTASNTVVSIAINSGTATVATSGAVTAGVATFSFGPAVGGTVTVTATALASVTVVVVSGDVPTYTSSGITSGTLPGTVTLQAPVAAANTYKDSAWRYDGTNWEHILMVAQGVSGAATVPVATKLLISPAYATDSTVFYTAVGTSAIAYSNNKGQTWKTQTAPVGLTLLSLNLIRSAWVIDANTILIGSDAGIVLKTVNNGLSWTEAQLKAVDGVTSLTGTVSDLKVASNNDVLAVVAGGTTYVAKSKDAGVTFTAISDPNQTTAADASLGTVGTGTAFIAPASDYATSGRIFVAINGGIFRYPFVNTTTVTSTLGWIPVGTITTATGLVTAAGGPGLTTEGSGMVYATDSSAANAAVVRIIGLATSSTVIPNGMTTSIPTFNKLWTSSTAAGNVQLWTIGSDGALYTYIDTLGVAVAGVAASGIVTATPANTSTATLSWTSLINATGYAWNVVVTGTTTSITSGVNGGTSANALANTTSLTGLTGNTSYTATVWVNSPVNSFTGTATFATPPTTATNPTDLAPADGATGIAITPGFGWGAVSGATSYTVEVSTVPTFATLVGTKQTTTINAFAWTTPALAYSTTYYWRVIAITTTGSSAPVVSVFTTLAAPVTQPTGTGTTITVTNPTYTLTTGTAETPGYIWAIIGIGALLVIVVIVLIVRTRRVA